MKVLTVLLLLSFFLIACSKSEKTVEGISRESIGNNSQKVVEENRVHSIPTPDFSKRCQYDSGSFSHFVQSLPMKKRNQVRLYTGKYLPSNHYSMWGIVDIPLLFRQDLEQCADFAMRIWGEYHRSSHKMKEFYLFNYSGRKFYFSKTPKSYEEFLKRQFSISNSYSLKKGCAPIKESELRPGDMIVQNETGGIGHVSMIVDVSKDSSGNQLYLIGYSFMPAQEFHIEYASEEHGIDGWFSLEGFYRFLEENLDLGTPVLRRF